MTLLCVTRENRVFDTIFLKKDKELLLYNIKKNYSKSAGYPQGGFFDFK